MNYNILLEIAYENILDSPIEEIPYWVNIKDNLLALKKENPILIKIETGNEINDYLFRECLDAGLTEVEFWQVSFKFHYYMKYGLIKEYALESALLEVMGKME